MATKAKKLTPLEAWKARFDSLSPTHKTALGMVAGLLQDVDVVRQFTWMQDFARDALNRASEVKADRKRKFAAKQKAAKQRENWLASTCAPYFAMKRKRVSNKKIVAQICADHPKVGSSEDIQIVQWTLDISYDKARDMVFNALYMDVVQE